MLTLKDLTIEDALVLADIYSKAEALYKDRKVIPWTEAILEVAKSVSQDTANKPIDWRNIKEGTPVLFRRTKDSEYEAGTWTGCSANAGALSGTFCGYLTAVSGNLVRQIGASITATGEWHVDPFWCKLA
jgi:hypothetical protein